MRRTLAIVLAIVFSLIFGILDADAKVVGFAETHEFTAPDFGPLAVGERPAERGIWEYWNDNLSMAPDPSCTSSKILLMDASEQVSEVHAVFTHVEKYGMSETKMDLGVSRTDVRSGKVSVYSAETQSEVPIFEYVGNGQVEVFGEITDDIGYTDVFAGDCALGEDFRQTLRMFLNFEDWNMRAELTTREGGSIVVREYGPVPMPATLAQEGIEEVRFYMPGGSGQMMVDGMVCTESFLPPDSQTGSRSSSWGR